MIFKSTVNYIARHLVLTFLLICSHDASLLYSTTVVVPSFDDLVNNSEVIFEGTVLEIKSKWVGENQTRRIETDFTFKVDELLKGTIEGNTYVLKVLGGTVGDVSMVVEGAPNFKLSDRSLLFVTKNGMQFVPLVGIMHGHYKIKKDALSNQDVVFKHDGSRLINLQDIGLQPSNAGRFGVGRIQGNITETLTAKSFKENIRIKLNEK